MSKPLRVLLVEDSETDTELLLRILRAAGYQPTLERVDTAERMKAALNRGPWDIVLADYRMPQFSALEALGLLKESGLDLPFIIVSGGIAEATAVAAMNAGAHDYLMKDNLARLIPAVERELREAEIRAGRRRTSEALQRSDEQFRVAREIQQHLFPKEAPAISGFDVAGVSQPAEAMGGDYFDYLTMREGRLGLVVGDVTGHGVGPALLMAEARAYLRLLAQDSDDLGVIMTRANAALALDVGTERFVTLLLVALDPQKRLLGYVNAGHPSGYVFGASGEIRVPLKRTGLPLGIRPDSVYTAAGGISLDPGEIVVLLTDGFEEAVSPDDRMFGIERVFRIIREHRARSAQEIVRALCDSVHTFLQGQAQTDDVTVIVAKALA